MKVKEPTTVEGLTEKINRMKKRQDVEWNRHRELHIGRLLLKLAAMTKTANNAVNLDDHNPNLCEFAFGQSAANQGWSVTKRGWPDYLCWKGDEVIFVEVKPDGGVLSQYQVLVMEKLSSLGLKCYKWTPSEGFRRIFNESTVATPAPPPMEEIYGGGTVQ